MQRINNQTQTNTWATVQSLLFDGSTFDEGSIGIVYTDATTAGNTFTRLSGNSCTMTAHGQVTGAVGQCTTTGGLPTGLSTSTNYWIIVIDANTVQFASTLAHAVSGTAVAITGAGTGVQTFTPTTLATTGAVCKLQVSNDGINFSDVTSATVTITSAGNSYWELCIQATGRKLRASWYKILFTPTTGTVALSVTPNLYRNNN